jgi:hypothetical protein
MGRRAHREKDGGLPLLKPMLVGRFEFVDWTGEGVPAACEVHRAPERQRLASSRSRVTLSHLDTQLCTE